MDRGSIREQIEYYKAQAPDYRHVVTSSGPFAVAREKLLHLGRQPHVLELAPGAGDWTQELVRIGDVVTVVDASAEMIEINRRRVGDARVIAVLLVAHPIESIRMPALRTRPGSPRSPRGRAPQAKSPVPRV